MPESRETSGDVGKLRVALLTEYPSDEDGVLEGGIQSVGHALAHALARRDDVECHVICSTRHNGPNYRQVGNLHVHFLPRLPLPRLWTDTLIDIPALLRKIEKIDPDIVHGQGQDRHALAAVRCDRPSVVTPHGVIYIESGLKVKGWWDIPARRRKRRMDGNERKVFEQSDHMIIISRYLEKVFAGMMKGATHLIENPIDPAFFDVERQPESGRLLFVGTVVPRKQVLDLVYGMGALKKKSNAMAHLRVVGPLCDAPYEADVRGAIESLDIGAQVTLKGGVSQEELVDEFRRADALVLASREETAPQVIAQAFACGLPVIASRAGGVPYMVRDNETALLFEPGDVDGFAKQLARFLDDDRLRRSMSETVRAEAPDRFHPDNIAAQTADTYRKILARP